MKHSGVSGMPIIRRILTLLPWVAAFWLGILALLLDGSGTAFAPSIDPAAPAVMISAALALAILMVASAARMLQLRAAAQRREAGARLSWRLIRHMLLVALPPLLLLYAASMKFVHSSIEGWFQPDVAEALDNALQVAQRSVQLAQEQHRNELRETIALLNPSDRSAVANQLDQTIDRIAALELTVFASDRQIVASAAADARYLLPLYPELPSNGFTGSEGLMLLESPSGGQVIRLIIPLSAQRNPPILQARFAFDQQLGVLTRRLEAQTLAYTRLSFLRNALRYTLSAVLSFVLLAAALGTVFLAFALARRLSAPIRELAAATEAIAAGDLDVRLPEQGDDELTALARSFNRMTTRLAAANVQVRSSQDALESERAFLATVIERISSGVITFDGSLRLLGCNGTAQDLLEVDLSSTISLTSAEMAAALPGLRPLTDAIERGYASEAQEWRQEVALIDGRKLLLRAARLPEEAGLVVLFEDQSEANRQQRESAWGEVAQRLAHEIKNPLTPIQLAAERLRHRYLGRLGAEDGQVLDRATNTIVAQVDALKSMVNAFSDYARAPRLNPKRQPLGPLILEVVELYSGEQQRLQIHVELPAELPPLRVDSGRVRQLLHNLLKNASEAANEQQTMQVWISVKLISEGTRNFLELRIDDDGPGIAENVRERLFEPYVTSKAKGSGLGLAIVKRIVEEHGGQIRAETSERGGALFRLRLPL